MHETRAKVLRIVASPKEFIWAPFELAIVNIVFALVTMLLMIGVFDITPFFSLAPLIIGHAFLTIVGIREPHVATIIQATGKFGLKSRNLARTSAGRKYVP